MTGVLLIDGSFPGLAVGLARDGSLIESVISLPSQGSSTRLASMVETVMRQASLSFDDLEGVCVSTGPGSFTGIRMGLAFAYGLKGAIDTLPLVGFPSLGLLAKRSVSGCRAWVLPGTKNQGFLAFSPDEAHLKLEIFFLEDGYRSTFSQISDIGLAAKWPEFLTWFPERSDENTSSDSVVTETSSRSNLLQVFDEAILAHSLSAMAHAVADFDVWSQSGANVLPQPNYLRASTAEENMMKRRPKGEA